MTMPLNPAGALAAYAIYLAERGYDDGDCPACGAVRGEFCREDCPAAAEEATRGA